jgi:hypothetical protein
MKNQPDVPLRYRVAFSLIYGGISLFLFGVVFAMVQQADRVAANQAWRWVMVTALVAVVAAAGAFGTVVAWGTLSDPKSRLGAWVRKWLVDAVHYAAGEAFLWGCLFLIYLAFADDIFVGVAVLFCWVLLALWILRGLNRDVEALDDPSGNPRTNRLIDGSRERGSYDDRD